MKSFLISDNRDTLVGMRLCGIQGVVVHEKTKVLEELRKVIRDPEVGLVIVTEKIVDLAKEEILDYKLKQKKPLIIEIPDRHGTTRGYDVMTNYIKESVGIRI